MSPMGTKLTADSISFLVRAIQQPVVDLEKGPAPGLKHFQFAPTPLPLDQWEQICAFTVP